ncbi:hypothetical protein O181_073240 [Austropuccinia psidii MF-1]|uniref:Integrase catalytic domain-containing protein n=1 Tax=Austropuccinia psidii MF-1 TaxID=1389203 RepID=A0A9Q3FA63_9BASI|nr:hypothetical protein [Austropuccinia psidii MF-1]
MDLVGSITPPSISQCKFFLTITDQASLYKIVSFLKNKSECFEKFKTIKKKIEVKQERKIKRIVSDWEGEFLNQQFAKLTTECGIIHTFALTETPQHNGYAERTNQTLLDKARGMLNATNLTKQYWAEAINTTTFISNLTPTISRNNQSPAAIWNNNQPTLTKLRVFGCQAITFKLKKEHSWKLDQRGQEGIMLVYENENTAYRILQLHDRKTIITRHVKFNEKIFPKISNNTSHEEKWTGITEEQSKIATASTTNNDHPIEKETEAQQPIQEINENRENNEE